MLNYISGTIEYVQSDAVIVDANGIGYEISVNNRFLSKIGSVGDKIKVYVYLAVKEDGAFLFGFIDRAERNMFLRLITISGIGPKLAISILGGISSEELSRCIANGDTKALSSIKGIGKKTAERIILELRDKIEEEIVTGVVSGSESPAASVGRTVGRHLGASLGSSLGPAGSTIGSTVGGEVGASIAKFLFDF